MSKFKVALVHTIFPELDIEYGEIEKADGELIVAKDQTEEEMIRVVKDADAIVTVYAEVTEKIIDAAEKCKIIVRTGIGTNNIDINAATKRGIYVANVPDYCFDEVSDHAIALALALSRKIVLLNQKVKRGEWDFEGAQPILAMRGQTFGLMGFGNIPKFVAKKAKVFGFNVIAYDPYVKQEDAKALGVKLVDLETLLKESDFVSLHAPLTEETMHVINEKTLKLMKPTAFLINTARGPLVDEKAICKALKEKWIAGAGLDVLEQEPPVADNPLFTLYNVILTPHAAFTSDKSEVALRVKAMQEAIRGALGEKPKNWVNRRAMESK
ncbi:MAG: C-terminal binding protein [Bacillota bacterium]|nr:C-terminal binding protein [Bacillota bacterium]MDD3297803.1 C-terminal binding protein [Bacillota bacterium]MDD3850845.1 C-terminal binding protein [Bacillota bacterium]MDD4707524.1 C-terminal binding protein [Bacillota bacterium]